MKEESSEWDIMIPHYMQLAQLHHRETVIEGLRDDLLDLQQLDANQFFPEVARGDTLRLSF